MSDKNTRTIESYNQNASFYVQKDANDHNRTVSYWPGVERFLKLVEKDTRVFEIGSGTGSDARRIEKAGYTVVRSDAAASFMYLSLIHI